MKYGKYEVNEKENDAVVICRAAMTGLTVSEEETVIKILHSHCSRRKQRIGTSGVKTA